ncbi:TonB-dependent receptor [bacterium]|nr:TonB-dependent receptor [bacterium]
MRDIAGIRLRLLAALITAATLISSAVMGQGQPRDLTELDLEELMSIDITLASRRAETMLETAAAVEVITAEDLHRSGATTIAEALRLVPGMVVARVDANKWAINSRGFNNLFANKLLVMVDGRSVYSPIFSGTFWEAQDCLFEDIDRIEVIRGPGAALWGANAVNGIIHVITRKADETTGLMIRLDKGTLENSGIGIRAGFRPAKAVSARVWGKSFDRNPFQYRSIDPPAGRWINAADGWQVNRGGFRVDAALGRGCDVTVQGQMYRGDVGQTLTIPRIRFRLLDYETGIHGGNLLGRFHRTLSSTSDMTLQLTYDRVKRTENVILGGGYHMADTDFQHRFSAGKRHTIVWGAGYRVTSDRIINTQFITFRPPSRTFDMWSAFAQDEIGLAKDRIRLTIGAKFERNDFTGFEFQPNARMLFRLGPSQTAWWAVSRAARTPSRADEDIRVPVVGMTGNHVYGSEHVTAHEIGFHRHLADRWMIDAAAFFNHYDDLQSFEGDSVANNRAAETYGTELSVRWRPLRWWQVRAGYAWLHINEWRTAGSVDVQYGKDDCPEHQGFIRASLDLPAFVQIDVTARAVGRLPSLDIPAYEALDMRIGWKPDRRVELSVTGQNLNIRRHVEFRGWWIPFEETYVPRSVYGTVTVTL